jgi:hypothetical protein
MDNSSTVVLSQISEDFAIMHRGKEYSMATNWPELCNKMIPMLCRSKDKEAKLYQQIMCNSSIDS